MSRRNHKIEIDLKRVNIFAKNIRDGFTFDPIKVEPVPENLDKYRLLDGAHRWNFKNDSEPVNSKENPDLVILDPPYFAKKAEACHGESISGLSKKDYLDFFSDFFLHSKTISKKSTKLTFINADWRDFQGTPAAKEEDRDSILIDDYLDVLNNIG